ncbi:MAG TPA: hypothetical protein VKE74_03130 [Gemmataceae bacterium]|nr:hypothetical protein [Gemmataceae bacterium]
MSRRNLYLVPLVALLPGCVPMTEPLSDVHKAEPVKGLIGKWRSEMKDRDYYWWEIDRPEVKGNPPGLMRIVVGGRIAGPQQAMWFYSTRLGKHTYMTTLAEFVPGRDRPQIQNPELDREGEFADWEKRDRRRYFVTRYTLDEDRDGDRFATYYGNPDAQAEVMKAEGIGLNATEDAYKTPPGWLAKYLTEKGPDKLFPPPYVTVYRRVKE